MTNKKYILFLAMLVLAIFAVGSVSAADNVTADIDVPTEDIAVDDVSVDETVENDDTTGGTRDTYDVYETYTSTQINSAISNAATTTHQVSFAPGTYNNTALTLVSNVNLIGNGAKLVGDGVNTVINVADCDNFTITGFEIDGNYISPAHNITIIRGSSVTNGNINNNILYNAYSGINIFRSYANMTIENNIVRDMIYDGISLAHPNSNNNINDDVYSSISGNNVTNCTYAIFIGGNFKGEISNNNITACGWGIQSVGKKEGAISNIIANITGNKMVNVNKGIEFINMTVISLIIDSNEIIANTNGYTIDYGTNFSRASTGILNVTYNEFTGIIKRSFINKTTEFDNIDDGTIDEYN